MREHNAQGRPGDVILDRYMADASTSEREAAREQLRAFAIIVVAITMRRAREDVETTRENSATAIECAERQLPLP